MPNKVSNKPKITTKKTEKVSKKQKKTVGKTVKTIKTQEKKAKDTKTLSVPVVDLNGKSSRVTLPGEIFRVKVKPEILAQAVRVYLGNQRAGTARTKTRAEVRGGGRKPWRQKGTGRARQGSIRAPQWRGGGIVFGPGNRNYSLHLLKKMKRKALAGAISQKFAKGEIRFVDNFEKIKPKTAELVKALEKLDLSKNKILWIVDGNSRNLLRAGRNLPQLTFSRVESLNTYQILNCQTLVFNKSSLEKLKERI